MVNRNSLARMGVHLLVFMVVVLLPTAFYLVTRRGTPPPPKPVEGERKPLNLERRRIEAKHVERLVDGPRVATSQISLSGKGENADWGLKTTGSFVLTYNVVCESEILKKEKTLDGDIKVVERRTYPRADQVLQVSDADVRFAFKECLSMPLVVTALGAIDAATGLGSAVAGAMTVLEGKNARTLLGGFGLAKDQNGKDLIDAFIDKKVRDLIKPFDLQGQSYIVTYVQDAEAGKPSMVTFRHEDGRVDLTEEERMILRRVNVFMDSQFMPDSTCQPGDRWQVDSGDFSCLLDPFVDGYYDGAVTVRRQDNDQEGNWVVRASPTTIAIRAENRKMTGTANLRDGQVILDPDDRTVKTAQIVGDGELKSISHHHLLFKARVKGDCQFVGQLMAGAKR